MSKKAIDVRLESGVLADLLRRMLRIRVFEEQCARMVQDGEIVCPVHLYVGQEAIAAGVCANLRDDDFIFSTHRSHGHYIAKGGNLSALMAEILGKDTGCSRGHGGSMHIVDTSVGFIGSSAIVGGTIPLAVGAALSIARQGRDGVAVAFFGDGATDEGVFYESVNFAVLNRLPVLFVCENNAFSTHMPDYLRQSNIEVFDRVRGFKIESRRISGNDAVEVFEAARVMVDGARRERKPQLLECLTYRWLAHVGATVDEDVGYRTKKDIDLWKSRCPIERLRRYFRGDGELGESLVTRLEAVTRDEVAESLRFARSSPYPDATGVSIGLPSEMGAS